MLLLSSVAVFLSLGLSYVADTIVDYAYYALVVGVLIATCLLFEIWPKTSEAESL